MRNLYQQQLKHELIPTGAVCGEAVGPAAGNTLTGKQRIGGRCPGIQKVSP